MTASQINLSRILRSWPYALVLVVAIACDRMDEDAAPRNPQVSLEGNEVFTLSNTNAYIDLFSILKTTGQVKVSIATQPMKGQLDEVTAGFLTYTPDKNFKNGKDAFVVSVFSMDNTLLKRDSIRIIIESDTAALPCGVYPQDDSVFHVAGPVTVDVLRNDILCGDSIDMAIEIYRPDGAFPPHVGSAQVVDNKIVYTPGNGFADGDHLIYKVYNKKKPNAFGFAVLYLSTSSACKLNVRNDWFKFGVDSLTQGDILRLMVLQNDSLCTGDSYTMSIVKSPDIGTAQWRDDLWIEYVVPTTGVSYSDSLGYRVCDGTNCQNGYVRLVVE
jgi:hypothetical protein